jgi:ABC-2 type transport system permease protein
MVLLLLFGYALTLDVDRVPLIVWDQSGSPESRELLSLFQGSRYFALRLHAQSYRDIEKAIDDREATAGLVIPREISAEVASRGQGTIQWLVDGSDANTALIATGYARGVVQEYSRQVSLQLARRSGRQPPLPPIELRPRVWFNEDMESRNYIVPGLIAVIMMVIAALLTSLTVAKEWDRGTMEQLISTPVRSYELILGKLIPYFAIGMLDVLIAVLMGQFLFHVPFRGSVALLFAMAGVFLLGALSMGMLISVVTRSQLVANQLAMVLTFVPAFLLSGFMFAIPNMPKAVQVVTYLVPARYFMAILRGIYLKGLGLGTMGFEATLLALFALAMLGLANLKFRKKLV